MSLAWFDVTDIYLARGFAMHKTGRQAAKSFSFAATLPWERVLAMLAESMAASASPRFSKRRIRIMLSGALCPAIALAAPKEASGWNDLQQILPVAAAAALNTDLSHLHCALDANGRPIGAAVNAATYQSMATWAAAHKFRLLSVAPSWALATRCKVARLPQVTVLEIEEPDGTTLLATDSNGWVSVQLPAGSMLADPVAQSASLRRHKVSMGIEEASLRKLKLNTTAQLLQKETPRQWREHWSFS